MQGRKESDWQSAHAGGQNMLSGCLNLLKKG
jgi:hypothetical protein